MNIIYAFFPAYWSFSENSGNLKSEFSSYTPCRPFGGQFFKFLLSLSHGAHRVILAKLGVCMCPHILEVKRVYDVCQYIFSGEESMCWSCIIYSLRMLCRGEGHAYILTNTCSRPEKLLPVERCFLDARSMFSLTSKLTSTVFLRRSTSLFPLMHFLSPAILAALSAN